MIKMYHKFGQIKYLLKRNISLNIFPEELRLRFKIETKKFKIALKSKQYRSASIFPSPEINIIWPNCKFWLDIIC